MATQRAHVSIGIAGTLGPEAAERIAVAAEAAGFSGLWVNEVAGADSLGMLAAAAAALVLLRIFSDNDFFKALYDFVVNAFKNLPLPG